MSDLDAIDSELEANAIPFSGEVQIIAPRASRVGSTAGSWAHSSPQMLEDLTGSLNVLISRCQRYILAGKLGGMIQYRRRVDDLSTDFGLYRGLSFLTLIKSIRLVQTWNPQIPFAANVIEVAHSAFIQRPTTGMRLTRAIGNWRFELDGLAEWVEFDCRRKSSTTTAEEVTVTPDSEARHSDDFSSVFWHGQEHTFTTGQAAVVEVLWRAFSNKTATVSGESLVAAGHVRDVFKRKGGEMHPAWGTMIKKDGRNGFRLVVPPKPESPM